MGDNDAFKRPEPLIPTEFSKKLSDLGRYDTWLGAGQAAVGVDPKAPGGALYTGPRPDAIPPADPLEQPDQGGGTNRTETDDENARLARELSFSSGGVGPTGPAPFYEKEGESYAAVGGKGLYDETFNQKTGGPARQAQARRDLADVQGERSGALAKFYAEQTERDTRAAAVMKQKAAEDQANIQARQQKLDEATQFYTNDLADQGKFWTNPGNIVSAIAFSMMPIFSNDPTIGAKLINQAIDRDMANRQHAAQGTLGALQSNLAGYHKIAGDRQAGDLLAQAEAHRIAAQEIARIGAQFEGPMAQKQMAANIADQQQRRDIAQMEFWKHNNHIEAAKEDPRLTAARARGPGGFQTGVAHLGGQTPETGGPQATAVTGGLGTTGIPSTAGGNMSPTAKALVKAGGLNGLSKGLSTGAIKGSEAEEGMRTWLFNQAVAAHKDPDTYAQAAFAQADKELAPMAERMGANAASRQKISELQSRMHAIEALANAKGKDPNDFVPLARKLGVPPFLMEKYDVIVRGDPHAAKNKAAELEQWRMQAVAHFQQDFAGVINQARHELYGGAVSAGEQKSFGSEIRADMPWNDQVNYLNGRSKGLQAFVDSQAAAITNPVARVTYQVSSAGSGKFNQLPRAAVSGPASQQPAPYGPPRPLGPVGR